MIFEVGKVAKRVLNYEMGVCFEITPKFSPGRKAFKP